MLNPDHLAEISYLVAATLFIVGIKLLSSPRSAAVGNALSALAMLVAVVSTLALGGILSFGTIAVAAAAGGAVGFVVALRVRMTAMPQLVALFNGFGGAASALVAWAQFTRTPAPDLFILGAMLLSLLVGALTFSGSLIAFGKLQAILSGNAFVFPFQHALNLILGLLTLAIGVGVCGGWLGLDGFLLVGALALVLGVLLVIPIGGADMPVVIALLNAYSGLAVAFTGFVLSNNALIIVGSLVGASGVFLTNEMCKGMNRSLANVLFGGFGAGTNTSSAPGAPAADPSQGSVKPYTIEDALNVIQAAQSVIFVPGYGMAASQAQHAVRELADALEKQGIDVRYAIHPVAGRMPGHMNVLLAESNVPYDQLCDIDAINDEFNSTDVVLVVGANDVVNPAAHEDPSSAIYGMPILNAEQARTVMVLKRSMNPGFAGIDNPLFLRENTMMLFGDAKSTLAKLTQALGDA